MNNETNMVDYVFDYLENKGVYASTELENNEMEQGILLFLKENGVGAEESGAYYQKYIDSSLAIIKNEDLKNYFMFYPTISQINQLILEVETNGRTFDITKKYWSLARKLPSGLSDYFPATGILKIMGFYYTK